MGDLYKCKKCGQLLYGAVVPVIDGEAAWTILKTIEQQGYYEAPEPVDFLDSDFADFLAVENKGSSYRYSAYSSFLYVMNNMRTDGVTMGTKVMDGDKEQMVCSVCHSKDMYRRLGTLPTTYVDGRWDDYVESDHTWYILSESPVGNGSFTELEKRELNAYISQEDRLQAQEQYEEKISLCHQGLGKASSGYSRQNEVNLPRYFGVLMNIKTNIQMLETRLFELLKSHLENERDYVNSTSMAEDTVIRELKKSRNSLTSSISRLEKETEFQIRPDWESVYMLSYPIEPYKPALIMPEEPEYRQAGLFNRKQVRAENEALKKDYDEAMAYYKATLDRYESDLKAYEKACEDYEAQKEYIFRREQENWDTSEIIIKKREELERLKTRLAEVNLHSENPLMYADDTLRNVSSVRIKKLYDDEIEQNMKMLRKGYQIEEKLHTVMFVFPKYLDIVAVSKIYEYLISGKCTQLTGTNGAYRMYENEMRSTRVMPSQNFDQKINDMAVKEYTIYSMLSSVSSVLNEISARTVEAVEELKNTEESNSTEAYEASRQRYYSLIESAFATCLDYLKENNITVEFKEFPGEDTEQPSENTEPEETTETTETADTEHASEETPLTTEETAVQEAKQEESEEPVKEEASSETEPSSDNSEKAEAEAHDEEPFEEKSAMAEENAEDKGKESPEPMDTEAEPNEDAEVRAANSEDVSEVSFPDIPEDK